MFILGENLDVFHSSIVRLHISLDDFEVFTTPIDFKSLNLQLIDDFFYDPLMMS